MKNLLGSYHVKGHAASCKFNIYLMFISRIKV